MCTKKKMMNYDSAEYKKKCRAVGKQMKEREIRYRIYHTDNNGVRMTVCIGKLPTGKYVRGLSICSAEDNFCKAVGQYHAMVRVVKSACAGHNCEETNRDEIFNRHMAGIPMFKGFYDILLTKQEEGMFSENTNTERSGRNGSV